MKMHKIIIQNKEDEHTHKGGGEKGRERESLLLFLWGKKKTISPESR